jgi:hypothetical protein
MASREVGAMKRWMFMLTFPEKAFKKSVTLARRGQTEGHRGTGFAGPQVSPP